MPRQVEILRLGERRAAASLVAALLLAGAAPPPAEEAGPAPPPRLILVSWDGAGDAVVDRLLAEGALPHLAALARRGVAAEHSVASYPTKTAASHAALWTGCWGNVNGVTGNEVLYPPASGRSLLETRDGFASAALTAEPLYLTAALTGRRVAVLAATQNHPPEPHLAALRRAGVATDRLYSLSGFRHEIARGRMLGADAFTPLTEPWPSMPEHAGHPREAAFTVGDTPFFALAYDDPADPVDGLDHVLVRRGDRGARGPGEEGALEPRPAAAEALNGWSPPFAVARGGLAGNTFFRLFALAADGSEVALYQRRASAVEGSLPEAELAAYLAAYPGFYDDPFHLYARGGFGPPLMAGGDGTAEERTLEVAAHDLELVAAGTRWAWRRWRPDLLWHYTPQSDSAGHAWTGVLDPASPAHDPAIAARLWSYYRRLFQRLDAWLGEIVELAGDDTVVAIVSDHGMAGTGRTFQVRRALADAGLLATTPGGAVDLSRSRALAPVPGSFYVKVNESRWRGGIVPPGETAAVIAAATKALLAARDPETGRPPVARVFAAAEHPELGLGGPAGGDLYFDLAPGYYVAGRLTGPVATPGRTPWGSGEHGFSPDRREMHAIFYAAGPGVPGGVTLPPIRHIDVAPTLARLLALPAPAESCGRAAVELR